jgi:hypothetical protein
MAEIVSKPVLEAITITPNPVNCKKTISITVEAIDKIIEWQTRVIYPNEIYAGEEVGII